ncbi:MAG TPA: hypothetical protein VLJ59_13130 [Mycobacteriales bacterium]|nr:hypothetical protein [Mycobacteriales bacterium]
MVRGGAVLTGLSVVLLVAGCGQKSSGGSGEPSPPATLPGSAPGAAGGSPAPSGSAAPATLPDTCADVLTLDELDKVVGHTVPGRSVYILGKDEPKIHRTGRVTCRYGVHKLGRTTVVPVEVGLSAYSDVGSAADRIRVTVADQRTHGATPVDVSLGGTPGTVLLNPATALLVFVTGQRTAAISITKDVATGDRARDVLIQLGTAVLAHVG